jgi:CSLREA domain-containing protein
MFDRAAARFMGVAPVGAGTVLYPEPIDGGISFGVYGMSRSTGRPVVRLILQPRRAGVVYLRVLVDATADAAGRRLVSAMADKVLRAQVGDRTQRFPAPAPGPAPAPLRAATPIVTAAAGTGRSRTSGPQDVNAERAAWDQAQRTGRRCGTGSPGDANGDGCVDIVDLQATFAAVGQGAATAAGGRGSATTARVPSSTPSYAHTFVVDSSADTPDADPTDGTCADAGGHCTLRAAITQAGWVAGDDLITFDLPGTAPVTIQLNSALPAITSTAGSLTIDGYSQAGSKANTAPVGSNAVPGVDIRGNGPHAKEIGLYIDSASNVVRGLVFENLLRGIMLDGAGAHDNVIAGTWAGFTRTGGTPASRLSDGIVLNTGANHNLIGTPSLADRNVIGNAKKAIDSYGPGTDDNTIQDNLLCIGPSGFSPATCGNGIDHDFGPKYELAGGAGANERNVIGPTKMQGIEYSHGWNPSKPNHTTQKWLITHNQAIGNWVGFRADGSYSATFRSGSKYTTGDNGEGINVYDGSSSNTIEGNYIAAVYDGIQVMSPNATGNVLRGNVIGVSPLGQAAPLAGWGIVVRWGTKRDTIEGNTIRHAAAGGIGVLSANKAGTPQAVPMRIRISQTIVTATNGPAIELARSKTSPGTGANGLLASPLISSATATRVSGKGIVGATVEVYLATRATGASGLPRAYLGSAVVGSHGTWHLDVSGLSSGARVTALQIATNGNTSMLDRNVVVQ